MTEDATSNITEREQHILKVLVDQYIALGTPVGSRTLSRLPGIDISAASVRNVMGDLEEMGLLRSPHISAGRVPTSKAFRLFVDSLLEVKPADETTVAELRSTLDPSLDDQSLITLATDYLSQCTRMAGMVTVPHRSDKSLQQVEFLPLSDRRILAVLVIDGEEVQNRIVSVDRDYTRDELSALARQLNAEYLGRPLAAVRERLRQELETTRANMDKTMRHLIELAGLVFEDTASPAREDAPMMVSGETNLMTHEDLSDIVKLRELFDAFQQKREIYSLLERCNSAEGVQIFIGRESGYEALGDVSLVTAPYDIDGEVLGVLGVVGPKRMSYADVIPVVDVTSRLLGAALNRRS